MCCDRPLLARSCRVTQHAVAGDLGHDHKVTLAPNISNIILQIARSVHVRPKGQAQPGAYYSGMSSCQPKASKASTFGKPIQGHQVGVATTLAISTSNVGIYMMYT